MERQNLLKDVDDCLTLIFIKNNLSKDILNECICGIASVVDKYTIDKKCTAVIPTETPNVKYARLYVAYLNIAGKSPKTIAQYLRTIKEFNYFIGKSFIDVDQYDIMRYLQMLRNRGCKNRSLENQRAYVSSFYRWLCKERYIPFNPCDNVPLINCVEKIKQPYSDVELDELRKCCKTPKQRAVLEMLLYTGVRAQELCDMNIDDIDVNNRIAYVVKGKGGRSRKVYFNSVAAKYYIEYLNTRRDNNIAAFVTQRGRLTTSGLRSMLKKIANRAGVENVHPHRFRRTLATMLANNGMPLNEIMRVLGHAGVNTTMIYVSQNDKRIENSYERFIG